MFKDKSIAEEISKVMLQVSAELDQSCYLVASSDCSVEEKSQYFKLVGRALGVIGVDILNNIFRLHPDLKPQEYLLPEEFGPDGELTLEEQKVADQLTEEEIREIDRALLENVSHQWRKVARIVGTTMSEQPNRVNGLPDLYYAQRVAHLVELGILEAEGDLKRMGFSEVRLKSGKQEEVDEAREGR